MNGLPLERTLELAVKAFDLGNYPIGAVITDLEGNVISESHNLTFSQEDPAAHAELNCYRASGKELMDKSKSFILYSSLEPCVGCSFFLRYTNISKVVWALSDPYRGGFTILNNVVELATDFAKYEIVAEPNPKLRDNSRQLLYEFLTQKGRHNAAAHFAPTKGKINIT